MCLVNIRKYLINYAINYNPCYINCQSKYNIINKFYHIYDNYMNFHFIINKTNGSKQLVYGGSSFYSVGIFLNNNIINSCKQIDYFNDTYEIICSYPYNHQDSIQEQTQIQTETQLCINMTIILLLENYNDYTEFYQTNYELSNREYIDMNKMYCFPIFFPQKSNDSKLNSFVMDIELPKSIQYYSVIWHLISNLTENSSTQFSQQKDVNSKINRNNNNNNNINHINGLNETNILNITMNNVYYESIAINRKNSLQSNRNISLLINNNNSYHFIGSSHMKINFDFLINLLFPQLFLNLELNHLSYSYENFYSHVYEEKHVYVQLLGTYIELLCREFVTEKNTIIFQTGIQNDTLSCL